MLVEWDDGPITYKERQVLEGEPRMFYELVFLSILLEGRSWSLLPTIPTNTTRTGLDGFMTKKRAQRIIKD